MATLALTPSFQFHPIPSQPGLINVAVSNLPARQIRVLSQSWQQEQQSHLTLPCLPKEREMVAGE